MIAFYRIVDLGRWAGYPSSPLTAQKGAAQVTIITVRSLIVTRGRQRVALFPGVYDVSKHNSMGQNRLVLTTGNANSPLTGYGASEEAWRAAAATE